jgi:hypothetical protein
MSLRYEAMLAEERARELAVASDLEMAMLRDRARRPGGTPEQETAVRQMFGVLAREMQRQ